tara:strand:- start:572 stop:742 length:171 start_codon:yes stop_codon:yes gene_type:complete
MGEQRRDLDLRRPILNLKRPCNNILLSNTTSTSKMDTGMMITIMGIRRITMEDIRI